MNTPTLTEAVLVTLALLCYGIANITVQRFKLAMAMVLWLMSIALILHFSAIMLMWLVADTNAFSLHALLSFSACIALILDLINTWRIRMRKGENAILSKKFLFLSKVAFGWWIISFILAGFLIIM